MKDGCRTCGQWMMFPDTHRCPPLFHVIDPHGYGDADPWEYAAPIYARDAEAAAEKWADQHDCEGDYTIIRGSPATVHVRDAEGAVTRWIVSGESVPEYTASPADD